MATDAERSDMGLGLGIALSGLAAIGALGMYLGAPDPGAGFAFAGAVAAGICAVVAIHLYW